MFVNLPVINTCTYFLVLFSLIVSQRNYCTNTRRKLLSVVFIYTAKRIYKLEVSTRQLKSCLT